jgi:hypothetical protein
MRSLNSERKVVVKKTRLLNALRKNLEKHINDYLEAVAGYKEEAKVKLEAEKEKAIEKLSRAYTKTLGEIDNFDPEKSTDVIVFCDSIRFDLVAPKNFSDAYQQAIEMLEWEERDEVELTTYEFRCFVMDKWDWMEDFIKSNSRYLLKNKAL